MDTGLKIIFDFVFMWVCAKDIWSISVETVFLSALLHLICACILLSTKSVCVCVWQILLITQRSFKLNKYIEITIQSDNEICYVLCCVTLWHGRHKRQRLTSNGTQRNSVARYIQIMRVNFSFRLYGKIWLNRFNHSQKQTTKTKFHAHIFVHLKLESANKHTRSERRQWEFHLI